MRFSSERIGFDPKKRKGKRFGLRRWKEGEEVFILTRINDNLLLAMKGEDQFVDLNNRVRIDALKECFKQDQSMKLTT